jgi:hypothetical protein
MNFPLREMQIPVDISSHPCQNLRPQAREALILIVKASILARKAGVSRPQRPETRDIALASPKTVAACVHELTELPHKHAQPDNL